MTAQLQAKEAECQVIKVLPCIHIYIVTTGIVNPYNLVVIVRLFFEIQHPLLQNNGTCGKYIPTLVSFIYCPFEVQKLVHTTDL